jgi:hypothetical protein
MWEDPIVAEVRRVREELSARFNFDPKAVFADIRNRQTVLGERLIQPRAPSKAQSAKAAERSGPGGANQARGA